MPANNNVNQYDLNIDNTRNQNEQTGVNVNHNPYLNQNVNQNSNQNINTQMPNNNVSQNTFLNKDFIKGALIGAAAFYLFTNKNVQEKVLKVFGKGNDFVSAGVEELKERYEDIKAQMQSKKE